jgi:DNA polymerase-3 subunit delta
MLHVFIGEDDYSIRQALEAVRASIGDAAALMTNAVTLDGRTVSTGELLNAAGTVPFLADKRLVVVTGLLEKFEASGRNGRKKKAAKKDAPEEWQVIAEGMTRLPETTELVVTGGKIAATNPLLKALLPTGAVRNFPALKSGDLTAWINRQVREAGGSIAPRAAGTLAKFVGNDLWTLAGEVEKLVQYAAGRQIEEADVTALVSATREASIFAMVDAILEGRAAQAQDLCAALLEEGNAPVQLLTMIARQVRIIFQVKDLKARKKTRRDIGAALGLNLDFVLNKALDQSDRYTVASLRAIYHRLLDTDLAIKTGRYEGELALAVFIADMAPGAVSA